MKIISSLFLSIVLAVPALASDPHPSSSEPTGFANFVGTWTLKDDLFEQVWDGQTVQTVTIPNHITICTSETTASALSCAVDGGGLKGQIFWVADAARQNLHHLSHFGEHRLGVGSGTISAEGDLKNRISFADEPEGTYRIYEYSWVNADTYFMMSRQYDANDVPTGNYYSGTFIRLPDTP